MVSNPGLDPNEYREPAPKSHVELRRDKAYGQNPIAAWRRDQERRKARKEKQRGT